MTRAEFDALVERVAILEKRVSDLLRKDSFRTDKRIGGLGHD